MINNPFTKNRIKDIAQQKYKCLTCDNMLNDFQKFVFPICDECLKDLREIIKERRNEA